MSNKKRNQQIIDSYDYLTNAASTTEFTGLTPTPILTDEERESYESIYPFYPQNIVDEIEKKGQ